MALLSRATILKGRIWATHSALRPRGEKLLTPACSSKGLEHGKIAEQWTEASLLSLFRQLGLGPAAETVVSIAFFGSANSWQVEDHVAFLARGFGVPTT